MSGQAYTMQLAGIPFEPGMDDLDELLWQLEQLPVWEELSGMFTEALEVASFAREELNSLGVPPLPYFTELRPLVWSAYSINQHRNRASYQGAPDPLARGIRRALANWGCPILKSLTCRELRTTYALSVATRVLSDLSQWNPHPEEEEDQLEDLGAKMNDARQALDLEPIHETAAYFRQQALRKGVYTELRSTRNEPVFTNELLNHDKAKAGRKGGKPGEVKTRHLWAWRYIKENLENLAYDNDGQRLTRYALSVLLEDRLLPLEWFRQNPGEKELPSSDEWKKIAPSAKTLRESPIWLKGMGLDALPEVLGTKDESA